MESFSNSTPRDTPVEQQAMAMGMSRTAAERPTTLMNWNFLLFWQGIAVSAIGDQLFSIAWILWMKQMTSSGSLLGLVMMVSGISDVFFSWIGGTVADRYSRRKIMIFGDLIRGVAVLSFAALLYIQPEITGLVMVWIFGVTTCLAITGAFFGPATQAAIPDLVPRDRLEKVNSLLGSSLQIIQFLGQSLGGLMFRLLGMPLITLMNGITYISSAVSECFITIPQNIPNSSGTWKEKGKAFKQDLTIGLRYIWNDPSLRVIMIASAFLNLLTAPLFVILPFYIEDFLAIGLEWYGYLAASFGVGVMVGNLVAGWWKLQGTSRMMVLIALLFLNSFCIGLFGFSHHIIIAMGLAVLLGGSLGFNSIHMGTLFQRYVPSEMRGRFSGLSATMAGSISPLGTGLGGVMFDMTGQSIPVFFTGCGVMMLIVSVSISMSRSYREFVAYELS
jgi:MFS family permease